MMFPAPRLGQATDSFVAAVRQRLGNEHVDTGLEDGQDLHIWPDAVPPLCVARPQSATDIADIVHLANSAGVCIVPRGAGLSYTAGTVCADPHIMVDTTRLDGITVHPDDLYAVVGAGCTWEAMAAALRPHNLRVPIGAPISGSHSTIGGAMSQNLPGSMEAVLGLRLVLADGTLMTTGSAALQGRSPFYRNAGPDLTGLFLGDCGAFGIKTEITLRLAPEPHTAVASFAFRDPLAMASAIGDIQRTDGGASCLALDPTRSADAIRSLGLADAARTALALLRRGRSPLAGLTTLLRSQLRPGEDWALHVTVESGSASGAQARLTTVRGVALAQGGVAIGAAVPAALQARPFSVRGALGPAAERWVPVHGLVPLSAAASTLKALLDYAATTAAERQEHGITLGWLLSSRPGHMLFEPMLLWPDALGTQHIRHLPQRVTARAAERAARPDARAAVDRIRAGLGAVLDAHGAIHMQIGRYYDHTRTMDPAARTALAAIKHAFDPERALNPGSLGL
jgi:FAD/FMN-containing dehydrogenase